MTADENPLGSVIARAMADEAFKERLIADPAATLAGEGVALPEGTTLRVVEDTESVRHLVLPAGAGALTDKDLADVAAAGSGTCPHLGTSDYIACTSKNNLG